MPGILLRETIPSFRHSAGQYPQRGIREDSVLEITFVTPEGERLETNLKVKASDLELLGQFMDLTQK